MNIIDVGTSAPYPVIVGHGLLEETGDYIKHYAKRAETAALITDDTVDAFYGDRVEKSIAGAGLRVIRYVVPHGEGSKNAENYISIMNFLAKEQVTRSDLIVALGGGVVGDLAGFAAATYLRRIDYIQIPTTLLAQVDSSVGGKTAIDLEAGKNLAGAFYQPKLVLCDLDTLDTLPEEIFRDGCAEVIKYGILWDEDLFEHLKARRTDFDREYTVSRCIEMKRDVVTVDEFDNGKRQFLNFGHTLAHAAEALSNYSISHGQAVAMGMATIAEKAAADGTCSASCAAEIAGILDRFGLPVKFTYTPDEMYEVMLSDKKRKGGKISLILPEEIGHCVIRKYTLEEMKEFLCGGPD
ncbi:MAG: 3-dehydroquinate synthase [Lachnospiraceae bacterium]|nr:3-dehydroquinate synthase [Lachnospiraceae bacterium]